MADEHLPNSAEHFQSLTDGLASSLESALEELEESHLHRFVVREAFQLISERTHEKEGIRLSLENEDVLDHLPEALHEAAYIALSEVDDWEWVAQAAARRVVKWGAEDVNEALRENTAEPKELSTADWEERVQERVSDDWVPEENPGYFSLSILWIVQKLGDAAVRAIDAAKGREVTFSLPDDLLEEADTPTPRPETPEFAPDPFQGEGETAGILSGPLSSAVTRSLVETPDERDLPPGNYEQEWGADSTGHPIRVEELGGQYSGRVTLRVQAYGEPDPTAVDAEMGWAMLQEMEMEEVWLHAFLLAHASAPGRRGEREVIRIPRAKVEQLPMGFRNRNRGKWERAEKIKEHIDRLRSVFVQFQNVERHGTKLRFRHDMNATPLWSLRMVAEGEKDLFTGEEWSEWYLEAREGMWAEEFLHNHGEQWAPLPKEWFEQIDRRGSDWGQRLAVLLLFLFRTNRKQGGRVKLSAKKMLQACGVDLSIKRDSRDRYDLKQKLSSALEDLYHNYGMRVQDEDVNLSKIDGRSYWTSWKNQTVTIDPPEKIDRQLLSGGGPERASLPETRPGRWSKKQIEQLLERLGWTQKQLAQSLPVGKQSVSHYLNNRRTPSDDVRAALDCIKARHL